MVLEILAKIFRIKDKGNYSLTPINIEKRVIYAPKEVYEKVNETDTPASTENCSVANLNWFTKNWPSLIRDNIINGKYVLISDKKVINSSDIRSDLENEAKTSALENYEIYHI